MRRQLNRRRWIQGNWGATRHSSVDLPGDAGGVVVQILVQAGVAHHPEANLGEAVEEAWVVGLDGIPGGRIWRDRCGVVFRGVLAEHQCDVPRPLRQDASDHRVRAEVGRRGHRGRRAANVADAG